jgi:uncharacterized protein (TIGR02265 family)
MPPSRPTLAPPSTAGTPLFGGSGDKSRRPGGFSHSEAFVGTLGLAEEDHDAVRHSLDTFPDACVSRGMFFEGILDALARGIGPNEPASAREKTGLTHRIQAFSLYPHRDFYRLFYYAARRLHPTRSLEQGLSHIAELFYPNMFAENLAGKTLAAFLGKDPVSVIGRLVDAYRIAVPWNEHRFEVASGPGRAHLWTCKVEPCPFYPSTFRGIATGMVRSVTGHTPRIEVVEHQPERAQQRFVFRIEL